jgi:predicted transcriptional regulator
MLGEDGAIKFVAEIAAAYLSNNSVPATDVPGFLARIHATLLRLASGAPGEPEREMPTPAVPIKKSITDDYIVCLEDGRKFKALKHHLRSAYGLTPDEYRAKWGLPRDYPMVAPGHSKVRSSIAREIGIGKMRRESARRRANDRPAPS